MITPNAFPPDRLRVSIIERLIPSLGFAVAAISGAVGSLMIFRWFSEMRHSENAGIYAILTGMVEVDIAIGAVLVVAGVLGAIGILVSIIRLFTTNKTSSPPGIFFLLIGVLSLVSPFVLHYVLHSMRQVAVAPTIERGAIPAVADTVTTATYFATGWSVVMVVVLLAFSFIPFASRAGRKASPLVCLMLVEILIVIAAGVYFWEAKSTYAEIDRRREKDEREISELTSKHYESTDTNSNIDVPDDNQNGEDANINTNSQGKRISGGVLNSKAISLPKPEYPAVARAVKASGAVSVQVLVDERGEVVSAKAVSGHPLLRAAAEQAARQARFSPTKLAGQPVKVSGVVTYNFSPQ